MARGACVRDRAGQASSLCQGYGSSHHQQKAWGALRKTDTEPQATKDTL